MNIKFEQIVCGMTLSAIIFSVGLGIGKRNVKKECEEQYRKGYWDSVKCSKKIIDELIRDNVRLSFCKKIF